MTNIEPILTSVAGFLVAVGAAVVLFKTGSLISALSDVIRDWQD